MNRINALRLIASLFGMEVVCLCLVGSAFGGEDPQRAREGLREPLMRLAKRVEPSDIAKAQHPLDPALAVARDGLTHIRANVRDYSCTLVKQERINGELNEPEYMYAEVRNRKVENGKVVTPLSVYMYFLKPESIKGREVMYVEGRNNGKLVAHEANFLRNLGNVWLAPDGAIAMRGQLYPITEVGIENLVLKLIERGEKERSLGQCNVEFIRNAKINGRPCTVLQITHPDKKPCYEFNIAQVFIDDELNVPIRYAAYAWPSKPGGKPEVIECYTYLNLKLNVGLTEDDFNHEKKFRL
jgi:hypothetical protein